MAWYDILLRALVLGVVLLAVTRLVGKRAVGTLTPISFIAGITMGTVAGSTLITSTIPLWVGVLGLSAWGFFVWANAALAYRFKSWRLAVEGHPTLLVDDGQPVEKGLDATQLNRSTVKSSLREHNLARFGEVKKARLETSGKISAISKNRKSRKKEKQKQSS